MAELISALADAKLEAAESVETISKLRAQLEERDSLTYENSLYYHLKDDGSRDGPFCPTCHDAEGKHVRLREARPGWDFNWSCNVCSNTY